MQDQTIHSTPEKLLRLPQVLSIYPVSKSTWWLGVAEGRYPQPVKISKHAVAWLESDVLSLIRKAALDRAKTDEGDTYHIVSIGVNR